MARFGPYALCRIDTLADLCCALSHLWQRLDGWIIRLPFSAGQAAPWRFPSHLLLGSQVERLVSHQKFSWDLVVRRVGCIVVCKLENI